MSVAHHYLTRVQIEDTDVTGVVYHAKYLHFMERARSDWMDQKALGIDWQARCGIYFVVRAAEIDFLKPARLHQWVEIVSKIKEIRKASVIFEQHLHERDVPDTILCKATIKIACIDRQFRPHVLPSDCINLMNP